MHIFLQNVSYIGPPCTSAADQGNIRRNIRWNGRKDKARNSASHQAELDFPKQTNKLYHKPCIYSHQTNQTFSDKKNTWRLLIAIVETLADQWGHSRQTKCWGKSGTETQVIPSIPGFVSHIHSCLLHVFSQLWDPSHEHEKPQSNLRSKSSWLCTALSHQSIYCASVVLFLNSSNTIRATLP